MNRPLEYHPYANLFPLIEGRDFDEFCAGIKADGILHDRIVLLDGQILDGRNRYRACQATGVTPHFETFNPKVHGEPLTFVISKNLHRRHLNESQRAMLAAELANMPAHRPAEDDKAANLQTSQADAAKLTNVSVRSVASATKIKHQGAPELADAVKRGHLPVSVAEKAVNLPPEKQREIVERAESGDVSGAKGEIKKSARSNREAVLGEKQRALPAKKYGVILADPEWRFEPYSRESGMDRAADNHYPTSATDEIVARPVPTIAADDCVLFLWATVPMLPDALRVMAAWGFRYVSHCVWLKDEVGTGYWFRNQHEILLVGTKGAIPAPAPGTQFRSALAHPVGRHSEKPPFAHEIAEAYYPNLPRIELNARKRRDGWDAWGLEAPEEINDPQHGADTSVRVSETGLVAEAVEASGNDGIGGQDMPPTEAGATVAPASIPDDDDLEIPPALRRVELTEAERTLVDSIDITTLTLNERQLIAKLRTPGAPFTELDRSYLARIAGKVPA